MCTKTAPVLRRIENSHGNVSSRCSPGRRSAKARYSRLNDKVRRHVEHTIRDTNFHARNEDKSLPGAAGLERKPVKQWKRNEQKTAQHGDCDQWTSNGQCSRGNSCSFEHDVNEKGKGTRRISRSRSGSRRHSEKKIPEGKDPHLSVRQETHTSGYATIFRRSNAKRNPHATLGTSTRML